MLTFLVMSNKDTRNVKTLTCLLCCMAYVDTTVHRCVKPSVTFFPFSLFIVPVCHCISFSLTNTPEVQWKPGADLSLWCSASSRWCKLDPSEYKYSLKMKHCQIPWTKS